jgi:hypothetical protein
MEMAWRTFVGDNTNKGDANAHQDNLLISLAPLLVLSPTSIRFMVNESDMAHICW